tara:strand:- start:267 stop:461 length:195 start_codon:yes stop_codon:yes gene_type:complete
MKNLNVSYKSIKKIITILETELSTKRESLKNMINDKNCTAEIYDKTVDECQDIEYAIIEIQKGL